MNYLFIVEGYHDVSKFLQIYPNLNVLSINGSAIDRNIEYISKMSNNYQIVLCFDPDYAGIKIRKHFENLFPNALHIHLEQSEAISKNGKKIGFEHVNSKILKNKIDAVLKTTSNNWESDINALILHELKLIGNKDSKVLRNLVSSKLNLGYVNSKTFLKRLKQTNITKEELVVITNEARNEKEVWSKLS